MVRIYSFLATERKKSGVNTGERKGGGVGIEMRLGSE